MTLVIRATENLTAPLPGSLVIPPLDESGVLAYYHADTFDGAADSTAVTSWADLSGQQPALTPVGTVAAVLDSSKGHRAVQISGTGSLYTGATGLTGIPDDFTIAGYVYINENPGTVCWALATIGAPSSGTSGVIAALSSGVMRAYGTGSTNTVSSSAVSKPGWVAVAAAFDYDASTPTAKIKVGSQSIVSGAISFPTTPSSQGRMVRMTGSGLTSGLWVRKFALLDHYATDDEMTNLVTEMAA